MEKEITEQERIDFIKTIVNYEKIDALMDLAKIRAIKHLMKEHGLYKNEIHEIKDTSIVNLLLKAQGRKPKRILKDRFKEKKSKSRIYEL